jgi:hypothetical protein
MSPITEMAEKSYDWMTPAIWPRFSGHGVVEHPARVGVGRQVTPDATVEYVIG